MSFIRIIMISLGRSYLYSQYRVVGLKMDKLLLVILINRVSLQNKSREIILIEII